MTALSLSVLSHVFGAVDKTSSSFSAHGKIGNFIIIIIMTGIFSAGRKTRNVPFLSRNSFLNRWMNFD